jgi:hypothetical protein
MGEQGCMPGPTLAIFAAQASPRSARAKANNKKRAELLRRVE